MAATRGRTPPPLELPEVLQSVVLRSAAGDRPDVSSKVLDLEHGTDGPLIVVARPLERGWSARAADALVSWTVPRGLMALPVEVAEAGARVRAGVPADPGREHGPRPAPSSYDVSRCRVAAKASR